MANALDKLVHELGKLPSVGNKTALRLALHILRQPPEYGNSLASALKETLATIQFCQTCQNISQTPKCSLCESPSRRSDLVCVVEDISDLMAIENTHSFRGTYHVLHGSLSPIDGIGPDDLKIRELLARLLDGSEIQEVIIATNPNVNGDATALYLSKILKAADVRVTKLASGIPVGGHIEFIDQTTLSRALEQRAEF